MGFSMLSGHGSSLHRRAPAISGTSLTPLILFAASPGTITGVITLSVAHTRLDLPVTTALVAVVVASAVTWLVLLRMTPGYQPRRRRWARPSQHDQFQGLIVLATGVQFALTGLHQTGRVRHLLRAFVGVPAHAIHVG